jgi:hypothetical protein
MATNTIVLSIVAAMAALLLAGILAVVKDKKSTPLRHGKGAKIRDLAEEGALRLRRQEALADKSAAMAHAARVEVDIKSVRADGLQQQATAFRSEAVTSGDQLNELRVNRLVG